VESFWPMLLDLISQCRWYVFPARNRLSNCHWKTY